jgi:hypothetical protein
MKTEWIRHLITPTKEQPLIQQAKPVIRAPKIRHRGWVNKEKEKGIFSNYVATGRYFETGGILFAQQTSSAPDTKRVMIIRK